MNAVIFDMDGLMFDTERVCIKAWDYAGEKMGVGKAGYMVLRTLGLNAALAWEAWKAEFGDGYDVKDLRRYTKEFQEKYYQENELPVKKGLYCLLDYLRDCGCKLAVASSSRRTRVEGHLRDARVSGYFQAVVGGDMVRRSKPNPEIYLRACGMLDESPPNCYALEDSKNGLVAAHRAGCVPIMVPDLWEPDEETLGILAGKFDDLEQVGDFLQLRGCGLRQDATKPRNKTSAWK